MHPTRDLARRSRGSLKYSDLVGWVVDVKPEDDEKNKRQLVRIRVPLLHTGIPDDKLPWALARQHGQANAGSGTGKVRVPPKGSKVMVNYDNDDPHLMYWNDSPTTKDVTDNHEILNEDYPDTYGEVDQGGNLWKVNTKQNTAKFHHKTGATIEVLGDGSIVIAGAKNLTLSAQENVIISSGVQTLVSSKGTAIMTSDAYTYVGSKGNFDVSHELPFTAKPIVPPPNAPNPAATPARSRPSIDEKQNKIDI